MGDGEEVVSPAEALLPRCQRGATAQAMTSFQSRLRNDTVGTYRSWGPWHYCGALLRGPVWADRWKRGYARSHFQNRSGRMCRTLTGLHEGNDGARTNQGMARQYGKLQQNMGGKGAGEGTMTTIRPSKCDEEQKYWRYGN